MFIRTKGPLSVSNGNVWKGSVTIEAGQYDLVQIANPRGGEIPWLVIAGTKHGLPEDSWRTFAALPSDDPLHIVIEE